MPKAPSNLTPLGKLIEELGVSLSYIHTKSGMNRKRLVYLRTVDKAVFTFDDAQALAPALRMSLDELAAALNRLKGQAKGGESSGG